MNDFGEYVGVSHPPGAPQMQSESVLNGLACLKLSIESLKLELKKRV